jgi:hypothetical protein
MLNKNTMKTLVIALLTLTFAQVTFSQSFQTYEPRRAAYEQACTPPRPSRLLGFLRVVSVVLERSHPLSNSQRTTRYLNWAQLGVGTVQVIKEVKVEQANYSRTLGCYNFSVSDEPVQSSVPTAAQRSSIRY